MGFRSCVLRSGVFSQNVSVVTSSGFDLFGKVNLHMHPLDKLRVETLNYVQGGGAINDSC